MCVAEVWTGTIYSAPLKNTLGLSPTTVQFTKRDTGRMILIKMNPF